MVVVLSREKGSVSSQRIRDGGTFLVLKDGYIDLYTFSNVLLRGFTPIVITPERSYE
ncbi:hypothetical protein VB773_12520 [Haloarculaceae archaeon H-GB2-1]|nr:hypothetical protein [Haloarculaceae archaeon H-GB11]MEA5408297.1 hypothetical protein [Haloarculaceae archaeon H-GB2-1]